MRLPNGERAYLDPRKVSAYLLSVGHPVGRYKWRFFRALGFTPDDLAGLSEALLEIAKNGTVMEESTTPFGTRYILDGSLAAPRGGRPALRTVWIIEHGRTRPRFVTAFPKRSER